MLLEKAVEMRHLYETFCCLMLMKLTTEPDQQPDQHRSDPQDQD